MIHAFNINWAYLNVALCGASMRGTGYKDGLSYWKTTCPECKEHIANRTMKVFTHPQQIVPTYRDRVEDDDRCDAPTATAIQLPLI